MIVPMVLIRIAICALLACLPFVLMVAFSRRPEMGMVLVIPFFGMVPAVVGALIVFLPIELYLSARGTPALSNVAVPAAGALLIALFTLAMSAASGNLGLIAGRIASGSNQVIGPMLFWSVLGVIWGLLWRLTALISNATGWAGRI